jgi:hypothetical protein
LPKDGENLLVAGRSASLDRNAVSRNMACCAVGGQRAWIADAPSVKSNKPLAEIDVKREQKELEQQGARH